MMFKGLCAMIALAACAAFTTSAPAEAGDLLPVTTAPASAADVAVGSHSTASSGVIVFSEWFEQRQESYEQCKVWREFRSQLIDLDYTKMTMKGSKLPRGISCSEPRLVARIAEALRTNSSATVHCGFSEFRIAACGEGPALGANGEACACWEPDEVIRPCIGNANWGGMNEATCGAQSQRLDVVFEYTPREPTACCLPDGSCEMLPPKDCERNRGIVNLGKSCDEVDCSGACCKGNGSCKVISEQACSDKGGEYNKGLSCKDVPCAFACCLGDGSCTMTGEQGCKGQGGIFNDGKTCDDVECSGACCLGDGSCKEDSSRDDCDKTEGVWNIGISCDEADCPQLGACCLAGGKCDDDVFEAGCKGVEWHEKEKCENVECPDVIRYSKDFVQGQNAEQQCVAWKEFRAELVELEYTMIVIKGSEDEKGFRCDDPDVVASIAKALNDGNLDHVNHGDCGGHTWWTGGCGVAVELTATGEICKCQDSGYTLRVCPPRPSWGGVNTTTCSAPSQRMDVIFGLGKPEPTACCLPDQSCSMLLPDDCEGKNGIVSRGKTCDDVECSGACCLPDKSCKVTAEQGCSDAEGLFNRGKTCNDVDCAIGDLLIAASPLRYPEWAQDVADQIASTDKFAGNIDLFNTRVGTPTPEQLSKYAAVLTFTSRGSQDANLLGDRLADFVDGGGGVVQAVFSFNPGIPLGGRWAGEGYSPFVYAAQAKDQVLSIGTRHEADHPVLADVDSFNGGTSSYHCTGDYAEGAIRIADWDNDKPLVGEMPRKGGGIIGLNFYPPSSAARHDFWDANTDGAHLLANSVLYAAGGGIGNCEYKIKKSKGMQGCKACPSKGDVFVSEQTCEEKQDCRRKLKTKIDCLEGEEGFCKITAKKPSCE